MTRLAFIGLGTMGYPMAGHLLRAGFSVTVWNRSTQKSSQWQQEYGGEVASSPAQAAENADIILTCVGRDEDLYEVLLGNNGVIKSIKNGSLVIDHSTVSANISREIAALFSRQLCGFIDAPVSGGQQGAINGQLSIFCGGDAKDIVKAQPILASYAKAQAHLGPVGHGQLAKMVNQICVAGVIQGLAEGMRFAEVAGLD
ncbi:MAG: NAD(P)-dependent oxidoreductase, partial [Moraxellaceae bacterium]|nr:NAD(P)-dependent oxidoreductase [Moraxellaceae bacterium]